MELAVSLDSYVSICVVMRTSAEDFRWIKQGQEETNHEWEEKVAIFVMAICDAKDTESPRHICCV